MSVIDAEIPAILEHRLTFYAKEGVLALTPGHDKSRPSPSLTPNGNVPPPTSLGNVLIAIQLNSPHTATSGLTKRR